MGPRLSSRRGPRHEGSQRSLECDQNVQPAQRRLAGSAAVQVVACSGPGESHEHPPRLGAFRRASTSVSTLITYKIVSDERGKIKTAARTACNFWNKFVEPRKSIVIRLGLFSDDSD